ncbi:MAG TPA: aspartate--ammonia ligase [Saprospiraceae bacterium]|nr:aspartate--ammonia ligase [Saprospiraceae bacterium]MCC6688210.1 aspartate--ammonia ligase [Saprospiraceae bacterium]HMV23871.1 aspartate--ammonia ligase [Saprospiraceae bacterium]HMW76088.1 aspartate--ammonia ligase [Saprospiraceae bacterium]HMX83467.1 aspartate--ammonia ligase [Saprospiraceae bacterium]
MNSGLIIPTGYEPLMDVKQTEKAIKLVKDTFQQNLSSELKLRRITAPLFVMKGTGINDDLSGTERAVSFPVKHMGDAHAELVHSLAKWKRMMLADLEIPHSYGIYTDMNAIRADEDLDNIHSLYVDQWDWERHISDSERNIAFLKQIVRKIFEAMKRTEYLIHEAFPNIFPTLPDEITFIHTEELLKRYPTLSPSQREYAITKEHGAVFLIGIGHRLSDGKKHDNRAPDYDDWITESEIGMNGLNGDLLVWNDILERSFELSSMGIRVNRDSLLKQLEIENCTKRTELYWHQRLLNNEMPLSIGGGIGQSRLCMYYLKKAHIGEVQASVWDTEMIEKCKAANIFLL